jgi:hypothetical protein
MAGQQLMPCCSFLTQQLTNSMETLNPNPVLKKTKLSFTAALLITILIAGSADILAAILILAKGHAEAVLRYIASAAFGKAAQTGAGIIWAGLFFHYLIAASFVTLYFIIYSYIPVLKKNLVLTTILYGLFVWAVMNLVVLPLTHLHIGPFNPVSALVNAVILIICIALPTVWMRNFYEGKKQTKV